MCLELRVEGGFQQTVILSPIGPEVGGDVGVEVGVAVVQGEGEGGKEPAETGENLNISIPALPLLPLTTTWCSDVMPHF